MWLVLFFPAAIARTKNPVVKLLKYWSLVLRNLGVSGLVGAIVVVSLKRGRNRSTELSPAAREWGGVASRTR